MPYIEARSLDRSPDTRASLTPDSPAANERLYTLAFWGLLALFCGFVLSLPLFPTGDSGLHIYYATIFRDLILHRSPLYAQFYGVRHIIQPYLLHYYVFIALRSVLSADAAEKVIVVAVLATFATGFRHMVRSLSPAAPGLTLLVFPYLLNWPLAMGALNYDFALGLLFFAIGAYERFRSGSNRAALWRFVGLLVLFVLSHPVPLLLLVCILAVDLLLRWRDTGTQLRVFLRENRPQIAAFALACVAFVAPVLIADKSQVASTASDIHFHRNYIAQMWSGIRLNMFFARDFAGKIYNRLTTLPLFISLALVLASGLWTRIRQKRLTGSDRLAIFAVLFVLTSLYAPFWLNGSGYFSYRLWLPCWLLGIAASAGAIRRFNLNRAYALYGIVFALIALGFAQRFLRPIAVRSAAIERVPLPPGKAGLLVQSDSGDKSIVLNVNYPVYWWVGGRTFIAHDDVILNSAWLYLTIIPLRENGQAGLLRDFTEQAATENPNVLGWYFSQHPEQRPRALHDADFIFFVDPRPKNPDVRPVMRLTLEPYTQDWHCDVHGYYAVCLNAKK